MAVPHINLGDRVKAKVTVEGYVLSIEQTPDGRTKYCIVVERPDGRTTIMAVYEEDLVAKQVWQPLDW